jgi:hypothetical protein
MDNDEETFVTTDIVGTWLGILPGTTEVLRK